MSIVNNILSSTQNCSNGTGCTGDIQSSIVFVLLTVIWFGFVTILGFAAQQLRGRLLAFVLGCVEAVIALVAAFDAKRLTVGVGINGLATSLIDLALALAVLFFSYRIFVVGRGRASKSKPRVLPKRH